jgi:hypothetical protein
MIHYVKTLNHRGHRGAQGKTSYNKNSANSAFSAVGFLRLFQLLEGCAYFIAGAFLFFAVDFQQ